MEVIMNIFVCVKQVPDTEAALIVKDGKAINEDNIKWIVNPYDEYAIEEAIKLKEIVEDSTLTVLTLGPKRAESALRTALAMGADSALHIETDDYLDSKSLGKALANAIKKNDDLGLVFMGKQAIDDDSFLTHTYTAENLNIGVATNVISFEYSNEKIMVEREIDNGAKEKIEMDSPCIIGTTKGLNTPRYPSLMGMMKAKKKPITKLSLEDVGISSIDNKLIPNKLFSPPEKIKTAKIFEGDLKNSVKELVDLLKNEAKVL
jgi:electron transfer flavoprotein beta subunit